jgi:hypothetical protein
VRRVLASLSPAFSGGSCFECNVKMKHQLRMCQWKLPVSSGFYASFTRNFWRWPLVTSAIGCVTLVLPPQPMVAVMHWVPFGGSWVAKGVVL